MAPIEFSALRGRTGHSGQVEGRIELQICLEDWHLEERAMPLFGFGFDHRRSSRGKDQVHAISCIIIFVLWWNAIRDREGWSKEGLLATHIAADFFDYFHGSNGSVGQHSFHKKRRNGHEQGQPADDDEFHAHGAGSQFCLQTGLQHRRVVHVFFLSETNFASQSYYTKK